MLPPFPEALRARAARDLRASGVEIHVGAMVTGVDEQGLDTNSERPAGEANRRGITKIWAAGVEAIPLGRIVAEAAGVDLDRLRRAVYKVEPDLHPSRAPPSVRESATS